MWKKKENEVQEKLVVGGLIKINEGEEEKH